MAKRQRLSEQQVKINAVLPPLFRRKVTPRRLIFLVCLVLVTVLVTHFFDNLGFQNELGQQEQAYGQLQDQVNQQKNDLKHLIRNADTQINCLQLNSQIAKDTCDEHNKVTPL